MANREQHGNREAKKPKRQKQKAVHAATGLIASIIESASATSARKK